MMSNKEAHELILAAAKNSPFNQTLSFELEAMYMVQLDAFKAGAEWAAKMISKRAGNYDAEHGITDIETGTREYPRGGDEYLAELAEQSEEIISASSNLKEIPK